MGVGTATFAGITQIEQASFTLCHGITPSVAALTIIPQAELEPDIGDLTFTDSITTITFRGCKVDRHSFQYDQSGLIWSLTVLDRRWKWQFGVISGQYNAYDDAGNIISGRLRSAQELAALCLTAMGEFDFDVSGLPSQATPKVEWDYDNPAKALAELAEDLGCLIVLGVDDVVRVVRKGSGAGLPEGPTESDNLILDPPERPDSIIGVGGPSRYMHWFYAAPVGLDNDGSIKPISELSYAPRSGNLNEVDWSKEVPQFMSGVTDDGDRELAKKTVYFWYKIINAEINEMIPEAWRDQLYTADGFDDKQEGVDPFDWVNNHPLRLLAAFQTGSVIPGDQVGPIDLPGYGLVQDLRYILPLPDGLTTNDTVPDPDDPNSFIAATVEIVAIHYDGNGAYRNRAGKVGIDFEVDKDRGILKFRDAMVLLDQHGGFRPAVIAVGLAVHVRDPETWNKVRATYTFVYPDQRGTGPQVVLDDDIIYRTDPDYADPNEFRFQVRGVEDNGAEDDLQDAVDGAAEAYVTGTPQHRVYIGLIPISPDGSIQQVSWDVSQSGTTTQASRDAEFSGIVPRFSQRRNFETVNANTIWRLRQKVKAAGGKR